MTLVIPWLFLEHQYEVAICEYELNVSTTIASISVKFGADIHSPLAIPWFIILHNHLVKFVQHFGLSI